MTAERRHSPLHHLIWAIPATLLLGAVLWSTRSEPYAHPTEVAAMRGDLPASYWAEGFMPTRMAGHPVPQGAGIERERWYREGRTVTLRPIGSAGDAPGRTFFIPRANDAWALDLAPGREAEETRRAMPWYASLHWPDLRGSVEWLASTRPSALPRDLVYASVVGEPESKSLMERGLETDLSGARDDASAVEAFRDRQRTDLSSGAARLEPTEGGAAGHGARVLARFVSTTGVQGVGGTLSAEAVRRSRLAVQVLWFRDVYATHACADRKDDPGQRSCVTSYVRDGYRIRLHHPEAVSPGPLSEAVEGMWARSEITSSRTEAAASAR